MTLAHELDRYLSVRRSLGYDLGTAERALRRFVQYADEQGVDHVTTDLFLRCRERSATPDDRHGALASSWYACSASGFMAWTLPMKCFPVG